MNNKKLFKNLCSALVACSFLFTACKKESTAFKESSNPDENRKNVMVNAKLINDYTIADMQTYTFETQRLIFSELTPENKARLVKERIDYAKQKATQNATITILNHLKSMISSSNYAENPDEMQISAIETYIEQNLVPLLGYETTRMLVTSWGNQGPQYIGGSGGLGPNDCSCSKTSDWCSGIGKCSDAICEKGNGCGTFFQYKCNGECSLGLGIFEYDSVY